MHRRVLGAVALLVLVTPGAVAQAADDSAPAGEEWLWLAAPEPFATLPNFSADPPSLPAPVGVAPAPIQAGSGEIVWKWVLPRLPAEWHVPADTTFTAELAFTGLDGVIPVVDLESEATRVGRFEVRVDILQWSSDDGVATGYRYMAPELPGGEHRRPVMVEATTPDALRYGATPGDAPLFGIKVTLTGFGQNDDPPLLMIGHPEHPARIHVPGFPLDALREWNEAAADAASCNQRVLQQLSCDHEAKTPEPRGAAPARLDATAAETAVRESPALPLWAVAVAVAMLASRRPRP